MHLGLTITVVVGLSTLATWGAVALLRRGVRRRTIPGTDDVETAYITTLGTIYAIFLAFMVFTVWSRFYEAMNTVDEEASTLIHIYRQAESLPRAYHEPGAARMRGIRADNGGAGVESDGARREPRSTRQ